MYKNHKEDEDKRLYLVNHNLEDGIQFGAGPDLRVLGDGQDGQVGYAHVHAYDALPIQSYFTVLEIEVYKVL